MTASTGAIVVGFGGSRHSRTALTWAEDLARRMGRPLIVLVSVLHVAHVRGMSDELAGAQVVRELEGLLADSPADTTVLSVATPPGQALVRESKDAYLTVLGARTHGPLASMVRGSVGQHVTRHAHGPIAVVRDPHTADTRRLVVGVDDSAGSRTALEFALGHAGRTGCSVVAVHAQDHHTTSDDVTVRETVSALAQRFPDVPVTVEMVPAPPPQALADASRDAEMVVVGSRGRSPLADLLLGSVSRSALEHAQCPVTIVR